MTTTLYRPVGPKEFDLIEQLGWMRFPPRLPEQPIFYPVMNEEYAIQIARDWNVPASGSGFVTRFEIKIEYLEKFAVQNVGGPIHNELWIPAELTARLAKENEELVRQLESYRQTARYAKLTYEEMVGLLKAATVDISGQVINLFQFLMTIEKFPFHLVENTPKDVKIALEKLAVYKICVFVVSPFDSDRFSYQFTEDGHNFYLQALIRSNQQNEKDQKADETKE